MSTGASSALDHPRMTLASPKSLRDKAMRLASMTIQLDEVRGACGRRCSNRRRTIDARAMR